MYRFVVLLVVLFCCCVMAGGLRVSTDTKTYCSYSDDRDGTYDCYTPEMQPSLFVFDGDKLFTHTIQTMHSTYYIMRQYEDSDGRLILDVVSDVGNEYTYAIGSDYIMAQSGTGYGSYIIKFRVKSSF